ncbi:MAG: 30S ribosomal protein S20 [Bacteroidia bacterium]|nr:30S ribosomal protein S20 [Bacteroidia bacterium]
MANHKSSIKRIRQTKTRTLRNKVQSKSMRNALKEIRSMTDKKKAQTEMPKLFSMLDRLAKKNLIHKNKAANLKSEVAVHINKL